MVQRKIYPNIARIIVVFVMAFLLCPCFSMPVYADTLDIPDGIPGAGHNNFDGSVPTEINGVGVTMKKVAEVSNRGGNVPQGIAYGDGYFFITYQDAGSRDGASGEVGVFDADKVKNANGAMVSPDKIFTATIGHGQGTEFYNGLLWIVGSDGGSMVGYDVDGNKKETSNTHCSTHYHLAIDKDGTVWNVASGGSSNGDETHAHYAKLGSNSWKTVNMNHAANNSQASQGGGYNPGTDRVALITNGIIMTFPANPDMKGSDVHMFPFNCNPESEGLTFTEDGTGYALLRGTGWSKEYIMEVQLDDDKVQDDRESFDFSFYQLASRASVEFQQALLDGNAKDMLSSSGSKTGCAATYLGYTKGSSSTLHVLATRNTQNTIAYSYKTLNSIGKTIAGKKSKSGYGFKSYSTYGRILNDLGYDEVGTEVTKTFRLMTGAVLIVAYYLGIAVPFFFGFILDFLRAFNPFALLGVGASKLATYGGSLEVLAGKFTDFYETLYNMSLFLMLPLIAAFTFGFALLMGGRQAGRKAGMAVVGFVVRILIVMFAVPVIGAGYSHFLDEIDQMHVFGPDGANQMIYSELVDFQGWAHNTSLNPPEGITLKWNGDGAALPKEGIRRGARKINVLAGHDAAKITTGVTDNNFVNGYQPSKSTGMELSLTEYNYDNTESTKDKMAEINDLMIRYSRADVYSSSTYETEVKEVILERVSEGDVSVKAMILDGTSGGARPYTCSVGTLFGNGTISWSKGKGYTPGKVSGDMLTGERGLSTLGMFNYLTTRFDDSQIISYGANVSNSERVKDTHMSVTTVGSGVYGFLLYLQTVVSLFCIGIIGLVYGLGIIGISFKRGFATLFALPGMMLGSKQFMGKFLTSAFMLFVEILITIGFYALFCELILVINDAFVSVFV